MTNTIVAIVVLSTSAAGVLPVPRQESVPQTRQLDSRIGPAVPERYKPVRDAKDWANPYLVIRPDGIEVVKGLASGRKTVPAADLERTLIELPLTAWPYGKVVAVSESSLRNPDRSDDKPIAENLEAALAVLKTLGVTVERWPH